LIIALAE